VAIVYLQREAITYSAFLRNKPILLGTTLMAILNLKSLTPRDNHILAESIDGELIGHSYCIIEQTPVNIEDADISKKANYITNFGRIIATTVCTWELIPRISPVSPEFILAANNKEISNLQLFLNHEGSIKDPRKVARLKYLKKMNERIQSGEGIRKVSYIVHVMAQGKDENEIKTKLENYTSSIIASLEAGLAIRAERLTGSRMLGAVQEFFRASSIVEHKRARKVLTLDLTYTIPYSIPKRPPLEKMLNGIYLGRTQGGIATLRPDDYANPHLAVVGVTGYGKSTTMMSCLLRASALYGEVAIVVIDYSGEYEKIARALDGKVIRMKENILNPFELGMASLRDRTIQVVEAFTIICEFNSIQRTTFAGYVSKAYRSKGFDYDKDDYRNREPPTLGIVIQLMKTDFDRLPISKQLTVATIIERLEMFSSGAFGIFGKSTFSLEGIFSGFTVISLAGITSGALQDLIAWSCLQYIDTAIELEKADEKLRMIVCLDEAHKVAKDPNSLPVKICKESRKKGYSLWVATQGVEDLAPEIIANAGTVIVHRTEYDPYLRILKGKVGASDTDIERVRQLPRGEALVRIGSDPRPFFVKVEKEEIEDVPEQINYAKRDSNNSEQGKLGNVLTVGSSDLSMDERRMLEISSEDLLPTRELYTALGLDEYRGNKAKESIIRKGLVKTLKLPKLKKGGRSPEGIVPIDFDVKGRKGGHVHRYAIKTLAEESTKLGFNVETEKQQDGRVYDIILNEIIAAEVETGESDIVSSIKKLSDSQFKIRLLVCLTPELKEKVTSKLDCKGVEVIEFADVMQRISKEVHA